MAFDKDAFLTALDSMSVMDLNDLVKAIEEKFGVSAAAMSAPAAGGGLMGMLGEVLLGKTGPRGGHTPGILDTAAKSAARTVGSQVGREIIRGVLGSILGGGSRRR